jgi:tRNA-splicing ligase RtcB (3'-phosphate/5'-hydroxy nucleic acid ligase)
MARMYETLSERNRNAAPASGAPVKMWTRGVPVEDLAAKQLANTASLPFIYKWLAVMPDVHFGKGSTIGSVIPTKGAIIPAAVGVDIGCGMMAWQLTLSAKDLPDNLAAIRTEIERAVPHGFVTTPGRSLKGGWETVPNSVASRWRNLDERYNAILAKHPKIAHKRPIHQLGSLGTGNHFIELCLDEKDAVWVMLHSGSRGPGNQIGQYFIERAKAEMRTHFINLPDTDLAYLCEGTSSFDDYIEALMWAQEYAFENRQAMMDAVLRALRGHLPPFQIGAQAVNCHHNYVAREEHFGENILVTRKGAVRAAKDVMGIIPGSMGAKSFIVRGKGNVESFCSCSHGAGRVMSRNEAKRRFTLADHARDTAGVECRKDAEVIDETPKAYKDIDAVMAAQADLVEIVHTLRQVVCVKG